MQAILVVPNHRLGEVTVTGPVTGNIYHVTRQGKYIDADDAELLDLKKQVYCWRTDGMIEISILAGSINLIKEI